MLLREPAFTAAAAIVLALGTGATTAIFTLVHSLLLEPLPYPDSARLVWISGTPPRMAPGSSGLLGADFAEIRDRSHSYERVAGFARGSWIFSGSGEAETIDGGRVSPGFFETLGILPMLGRVFLPDEHRLGHEMEVIFSYPYWQRRFLGDPGVVGTHVTLDGISYEVVGVMPPGFPLGADYDMWAPLQMDSAYATGRRSRAVRAFGRLKPGVTLAQAQAEANSFAADFERRYSNDRGYSIAVVTFLDRAVGNVRRSLWIFAGAVGFVLLIACSNAATLLLARGAARVREMSLRSALGASRGALIRQMLVESGVLALLGGLAGFPLAVAGVKLLLITYPRALPRASEIRIDFAVFAFAILISLITGIIFGIVPAMRASRLGLTDSLNDGGRGSPGRRGNRFRAGLVVVEVALGVVLTATAGLLARSLQALNAVDPGYRVRNVLTMQLAAMGPKYRDLEECRKFYQRLLTTIGQMPGVETAATTNWLPLNSDRNWAGVWPDTLAVRNEDTKVQSDNRVVGPGYFQALGVPILAGRDFDWADRPETPKVMIVNDVFAREFFPDGKAVGHRVTMDIQGSFITFEIVGISGSFRELSLAEAPRREIFTPYAQTTIAGQSLVVRTVDDPAGHIAAIRAAVASIDPNVPIYHVSTMKEHVTQSLAQHRLRGALLSTFSLVGLVLATIGLYGVISCAMAERQQEIAIRMALGARHRDVRVMVVRSGLKLTLAGLAIGLPGAVGAAQLLEGFLYGVKAADPVTFAATAAIFLAVTIAATYVPARQATTLDPLAVLRKE